MNGRCEVVADTDIMAYLRNKRPDLIEFDGIRGYTEHPDKLTEYVNNTLGEFYKLIFIPIDNEQ